MGMFDTVRCKVVLPGTHPFGANSVFQTKSLDCMMDEYVIEEDGQLLVHTGTYEVVPKEQRPYPNDEGIRGVIESLTFVSTGWKPVDAHQRVCFYGDRDNIWYEWETMFTHGKLEGIVVKYIGPVGQSPMYVDDV